jgi:hypothetical protein
MAKIILANFFIFLIVTFVCIILGLDLKKWQSWLAGLYAFFSGVMLGFLSKAGSPSWQLGILFTVAIIPGGAVTRQRRIHYRRVGEEWLRKYGNDTRYSLLARIISKVLR